MLSRFVLVFALSLSVVSTARAQIILNHHGRLLGPDDVPVDGARDLLVQLWAGESAATPVWSETYGVSIAKGLYSIPLGDERGSKKVLTLANVAGDRWLSVTIDSRELTPRIRLGTVPNAAQALDSERLGGELAAAYALKSYVDGKDAATRLYVDGKDGEFLTQLGLKDASVRAYIDGKDSATRGYVDATVAAATPVGYAKLDGTLPFTGALTLPSAPTAALHAATKAYVDATVAAATPTGYAKLDGSLPFTGPVVLPGLPTSANHAASKAYVDSQRVPPDGNLLLSLDFDELSGPVLADGSSYKLDATGGSGLAIGSVGHSGKGVDFSGGLIALANGKALPDSSQIDVEAWIAPALPMDVTRTILAKTGAFSFKQVNQNLEFELLAAAAPTTACKATTTASRLVAGAWAHVRATYDGLALRILINGQPAAMAACPNGPIVSGNGAFTIGGRGSNAEPYKGTIDEVRVRATAPFTPRYASTVVNVTTRVNATRRTIGSGASHEMERFTVDKKSPTSILLVQGSIAGFGNFSGDMTQGWKFGAGTEAVAQGLMYEGNATSKIYATTTVIAGHTTTGPQDMVFRYFTGNGQSSDAPFSIHNPNATDNTRLAQTRSTYVVWEIEQSP